MSWLGPPSTIPTMSPADLGTLQTLGWLTLGLLIDLAVAGLAAASAGWALQRLFSGPK